MGDLRETGYGLPVIDLTDDNTSSNDHTARYLDLTENVDRYSNRSPELIDLTVDDNQSFNSNTPIMDLTRDNEQFANYRIQVIDLTDDDVTDITDKMHCIDLTKDNASSSNYINRNFDFTRKDDRHTNNSTELIDLAHHDDQNFNPNTPAIDLTCENDQLANYKIQVIDRTHDDVQDIAHQLQYIGLTDGQQQQHINDCVPTCLTYDNDQTIPAIHLTDREDYDDYERTICDLTCDNIVHNVEGPLIDHFIPTTELIRGDTVLREQVDDVERNDAEVMSCNDLLTSLQNSVTENNLRLPVENLRYNVTESSILKCTEASSRNLIQIDASSSMQQYQPRKETVLTNCLQINNEKKDSGPLKSGKISQNMASNLLKPARHPIPFRHSLGRSTINTSKNVPIEYTEASEGESRTLTVSSALRRKKSKPSCDGSKHGLRSSPELPISRNKFSFDAFKEYFLNFWIFLFYWILKMIRRIIYAN